MIRAVMLSVLSLVAGRASAAGIPAESMGNWAIVVSADAIESEKYAAEELSTFLEQATGIALPIANEMAADGGQIFVGMGEEMRASAVGFDTAGMGPDALRIVVGKRAIAIAGGQPRGTLYGVYTFLEDVLGVRFLTPDHTHVPRLPRGFVLAPMDKSYTPPVEWRNALDDTNGGKDTDYGITPMVIRSSTSSCESGGNWQGIPSSHFQSSRCV